MLCMYVPALPAIVTAGPSCARLPPGPLAYRMGALTSSAPQQKHTCNAGRALSSIIFFVSNIITVITVITEENHTL